MSIASALRSDRMCKALTGLNVREFEELRQPPYDEKETNKSISSYRVIVEHAIGEIGTDILARGSENRKAYIDDRLLLSQEGCGTTI